MATLLGLQLAGELVARHGQLPASGPLIGWVRCWCGRVLYGDLFSRKRRAWQRLKLIVLQREAGQARGYMPSIWYGIRLKVSPTGSL
jgi:hypothetical protein